MTLRVVDAAGRRHAEGYALAFGAMGSATTNEEPATITINDQLASAAIDSARASAAAGEAGGGSDPAGDRCGGAFGRVRGDAGELEQDVDVVLARRGDAGRLGVGADPFGGWS